jgi:hypothetical protein
MSRILDFRGYVIGPSGRTECVIWIEEPQRTPGQAHFHCTVGSTLLPRPMRIYAEDSQQAKMLAYSTVKKQLTGRTLLDSSGEPTDLPMLHIS